MDLTLLLIYNIKKTRPKKGRVLTRGALVTMPWTNQSVIITIQDLNKWTSYFGF